MPSNTSSNTSNRASKRKKPPVRVTRTNASQKKKRRQDQVNEIDPDSDSQSEDQYQQEEGSSTSASSSGSEDESQTAQPARRPAQAPRTRRQPQSQPAQPTTLEDLSTTVLPTIHNYTTFCTDWTDAYIDKLLSHRKETNNRPPPAVLLEAQALQHQYNRNKKILSLVGNLSLNTLEEHL